MSHIPVYVPSEPAIGAAAAASHSPDHGSACYAPSSASYTAAATAAATASAGATYDSVPRGAVAAAQNGYPQALPHYYGQYYQQQQQQQQIQHMSSPPPPPPPLPPSLPTYQSAAAGYPTFATHADQQRFLYQQQQQQQQHPSSSTFLPDLTSYIASSMDPMHYAPLPQQLTPYTSAAAQGASPGAYSGNGYSSVETSPMGQTLVYGMSGGFPQYAGQPPQRVPLAPPTVVAVAPSPTGPPPMFYGNRRRSTSAPSALDLPFFNGNATHGQPFYPQPTAGMAATDPAGAIPATTTAASVAVYQHQSYGAVPMMSSSQQYAGVGQPSGGDYGHGYMGGSPAPPGSGTTMAPQYFRYPDTTASSVPSDPRYQHDMGQLMQQQQQQQRTASSSTSTLQVTPTGSPAPMSRSGSQSPPASVALATGGGGSNGSNSSLASQSQNTNPSTFPSTSVVGMGILEGFEMKTGMLERPPYPLSTVLAYGIATSRSQRLTLQELYAWMLVTYPYYQTAKTNWRNTVRHTLSTNPAFVKIDKQLHEFGKGAFWMLDPARVDKVLKRARRSSDPYRAPSAPRSPSRARSRAGSAASSAPVPADFLPPPPGSAAATASSSTMHHPMVHMYGAPPASSSASMQQSGYVYASHAVTTTTAATAATTTSPPHRATPLRQMVRRTSEQALLEATAAAAASSSARSTSVTSPSPFMPVHPLGHPAVGQYALPPTRQQPLEYPLSSVGQGGVGTMSMSTSRDSLASYTQSVAPGVDQGLANLFSFATHLEGHAQSSSLAPPQPPPAMPGGSDQASATLPAHGSTHTRRADRQP